MRTVFATGAAALLGVLVAAQSPLPQGYWPEAKSNELLARVETIRLAPDLSGLSTEERTALIALLDVGSVMQKLYEDARHPQALDALDRLHRLDTQLGHPTATQNLLLLYRLNQGPIATTLDNRREPFLPVTSDAPARNVYPADATKDDIDKFLARRPDARDALLAERTIVRRVTKPNLDRDIRVLSSFLVLQAMFPALLPRLRALEKAPTADDFYAIPYSVAYADDMFLASGRLMAAADQLETRDAEFARYLRNRARDLLSNDYESGDASWVTGRFARLNAQIGAYETYDDGMYGVKAFHGMSILLENQAATTDLRRELGQLQAIEDALPYDAHKRVREDIPVGVYEVIADFGQARGTNTATILPNDPLFARRYGRTILLRENIMKHPDLFAASMRTWRAATVDAHAEDLKAEGSFQFTLWHEIGHYLGVDRDTRGRILDVALEDYADATEEMKADLVSQFALHRMSHPSLRAIEAAGILRTLQSVRPRPDQPYQTMELVQFNWYRDKGLIDADPKTARLTIHYDRYPQAVTSLLSEILTLQRNGDKPAAVAFFQRWTTWTPELHDTLAARIREAQGRRFRLVRYAALGE